MEERLAHGDRFRTWTVYGVVALHGAMTYMVGAPGWWYVQDPGRSFVLTLLVLALDVFLMPGMFLAAGYFAPPSLARRGTRGFLGEKALRLGIPWVLGSLLVAPWFARASLLALGYPVGHLGAFYRTVFLGPAYQQAHFWFLGVLLAFFLLFLPLGRRLGERTPEPRPIGLPLACCVVGAALWFGALGTRYPLDVWVHPAYVLVFQPLRVGGYFLLFLLGALAWRNRWLERPPSPGCLAGLGGAATLLLLLSVVLRLRLPEAPRGGGLWLYALAHEGAAVLVPLALAALFRRFGGAPSARVSEAAGGSYGLYWLHQMLLLPLEALLVPLPWSPWVKFLLAVGATLWAGQFLALRVLRRLPGLRRVF